MVFGVGKDPLDLPGPVDPHNSSDHFLDLHKLHNLVFHSNNHYILLCSTSTCILLCNTSMCTLLCSTSTCTLPCNTCTCI